MFCESCKSKNTCIKICSKVENYLQRKSPGDTYSQRWMREKEIPHSPEMINGAADNFIRRKLGRKKSDISMPKYDE